MQAITTKKVIHYLAVYTNEVNGEFALCSVSEPSKLFYGVLEGNMRQKENTIHALQDWLEQFGAGSFDRCFVTAQICRETIFFEHFAPYNPLLLPWIDVISYLQGFISGTGRDEMLMQELQPYVTPENVETEVVHQATLWRLVSGLPDTYDDLQAEMQNRSELLRTWRREREKSRAEAAVT